MNQNTAYMPWKDRIRYSRLFLSAFPWYKLQNLRHFSPVWFYVVMGTAITSDDFVLSYVQNHVATKRMSLIVWFIGIITLLAFTGLSIARMVMFPGLWSRMIRHPIEPLYLACVPMSMIPLNNGMRFVQYSLSSIIAKGCRSYGIYFWNHFNHFGLRWLYFTWAVWLIVTVIGYTVCFHVFQAMYAILVCHPNYYVLTL